MIDNRRSTRLISRAACNLLKKKRAFEHSREHPHILAAAAAAVALHAREMKDEEVNDSRGQQRDDEMRPARFCHRD